MSLHSPTELFTLDDDALREAVAEAHLPSLLTTLAHVLGDESFLDPALKPDCGFVAGPQGGYDEAQEARARELCLHGLIRLREAGSTAVAELGDARLRRCMGFLIDGEDLDDVLPLLLGELALDGEDVRAPKWSKDELAPEQEFSVAIIGAGMSGLAAALRLGEAGIDYTLFEKNGDVGGTWLENTYPGCRVDVPNHFYSYSFAQKDDWPQLYSTQDVLLDYFRDCADELGLRDKIEFETEVVEAAWDDERALWSVSVRGPGGDTRVVTANAIISCVGQLNRPLMPDIPGIGDFEGPSFHSARWDHGLDLDGKRVAVVGNAASAIQFIPQIAPRVAKLHIFTDSKAVPPDGLRVT